MLKWNVFIGDFNAREIKVYNIFDHQSFLDDCRKAYKKFKDSKEGFLDEIHVSLMYYFWSKCEWEVVVAHWPQSNSFGSKKISVYDQVRINWGVFAEYIWRNRNELCK